MHLRAGQRKNVCTTHVFVCVCGKETQERAKFAVTTSTQRRKASAIGFILRDDE